MGLQIEKIENGGNWLLRVSGEVDLYTSPELRSEVTSALPKCKESLSVDLGAVAYMDSSGVATLVEGLRAAGAKGAKFVLVAPSQPVLKVLQLSRLDSVFDIRDHW